MNETPTPSRRRGRPPKIKLEPVPVLDQSLEGVTVGPFHILAPPQESGLHTQDALSVAPVPVQAPTVPSPLEEPLPVVKADDVDLRENPAMAAKHSISGSDSKVRGASDGYLPVEAGMLTNPALPEQFQVQTGIPPQRPTQPERTPAPHHAEAIPAAPVSTSWVPIQNNDVVQINNPQNRLYGALFTVADIKGRRIHGYQLMAGGKHEYITANEDECYKIGQSKVRSRNGCSAKWNSEYR